MDNPTNIMPPILWGRPALKEFVRLPDGSGSVVGIATSENGMTVVCCENASYIVDSAGRITRVDPPYSDAETGR